MFDLKNLKKAKLSRATLEFQVKVCFKYGWTWCANVRLEKKTLKFVVTGSGKNLSSEKL